jgi:L-lactate dehydrogenase (cytochrome)
MIWVPAFAGMSGVWMSVIANTVDERLAAQRAIPRMLFDYIDGGSYDEVTLRRNVEDFRAIALRQRVMRDVSTLKTEIELFGQHWSMPVGLGPVGFSGMFAHRGERQAARAAETAGVPFTLSTLSICPLEEVRAAVTRPIWFQLYMIKDRGFMEKVLARCEAADVPALLFTVDLPVGGSRYRDVRSGFSSTLTGLDELRRLWDIATKPHWLWHVALHGRPHHFGNIVEAVPEGQVGDFSAWIHRNFDPTLTWDHIAWIRERWKKPIIIKGILDPEDARLAVQAGADGIVVSNHGGRQLDGALSSVRALPPVAEAVGGRIPILLDGGVRSGLDVLKALALGASGCLMGRNWAYALAAGGEAGVVRMLERTRAELHVAMSLTGCTDVKAADCSLLA